MIVATSSTYNLTGPHFHDTRIYDSGLIMLLQNTRVCVFLLYNHMRVLLSVYIFSCLAFNCTPEIAVYVPGVVWNKIPRLNNESRTT